MKISFDNKLVFYDDEIELLHLVYLVYDMPEAELYSTSKENLRRVETVKNCFSDISKVRIIIKDEHAGFSVINKNNYICKTTDTTNE